MENYLKKELKNHSIFSLSLLFYSFFLIVVVLSIYIFYNSHETNKFAFKVIDQTLNQYNTISIDSLSHFCKRIQADSIWCSKNAILIRLDTFNIHNMHSISQEFLLNQRNFIDGNGLSFIIGILSLFFIGLGIFGFQFFIQRLDKIDKLNKEGIIKMSQQIRISANTNKISNFSEIIYTKAIRLEEINDKNEETEICRIISSRLFDIQEEISCLSKEIFVIELMAKQNSLDILIQVRDIFVSRGFNKSMGYYKDIYNRLINTIEIIKELEEAEPL